MKKTETVNGNLVINIKVNGCISNIHYRNGRKKRSTKCFNGVEAEINLRFDNLKCDLGTVVSNAIKQGVEQTTSNTVSNAPSNRNYMAANPLDIEPEQYISRMCNKDRLKAVMGNKLYNDLIHIVSMDLPIRFIERVLRFCSEIEVAVGPGPLSVSSRVNDITYKCNDMLEHLNVYLCHLSPKDYRFINGFINDIGRVSKNQVNC